MVATRKKQTVNEQASSIPLVIGLFCMWALNYRELENYLKEKNVNLSDVRKFDIPYGEFNLEMTGGRVEKFEFEKIKARRLATCDLCYDFTSELADISVGSTELENDWNTVIVRSERGEKFWNAALDAGVVEQKPFLDERRKLLRKAAAGKKERTLKLLQEKFGKNGATLGYLKLGEAEAAGELK